MDKQIINSKNYYKYCKYKIKYVNTKKYLINNKKFNIYNNFLSFINEMLSILTYDYLKYIDIYKLNNYKANIMFNFFMSNHLLQKDIHKYYYFDIDNICYILIFELEKNFIYKMIIAKIQKKNTYNNASILEIFPANEILFINKNIILISNKILKNIMGNKTKIFRYHIINKL